MELFYGFSFPHWTYWSNRYDLAAMIAGGGVAPFIDTQSLLIVFGGTFFAVMYSNPLPVFLGSFGAMAKAFYHRLKSWMRPWSAW